jgi:hypothetical protein
MIATVCDVFTLKFVVHVLLVVPCDKLPVCATVERSAKHEVGSALDSVTWTSHRWMLYIKVQVGKKMMH